MLHFLRNLLRMKNNFSVLGGSTKFKTLKLDLLEFERIGSTNQETAFLCPP